MKRGMAMLSEDRKRYGLVPVRDIKENVGLSSLRRFIYGGFLHKKTENDLVSSICSRMRVKAPTSGPGSRRSAAGTSKRSSSPNGCCAIRRFRLLDEPTRGIDVGTKYEIYKIIFELAEEGKAILFISSELPEILALCDRVYVMAQGQIACELQGPNFDQERIMKFATMGAGARSSKRAREASALEASVRNAPSLAAADKYQGDRA